VSRAAGSERTAAGVKMLLWVRSEARPPKLRQGLRAVASSLSACIGILGLAFLLIPTVLHAQAELEYQNRGDRFEGVRPRPVSGYDIELISALVDYRDPAPDVKDHLRVKFFLASPAAVHLTIRELDVKHYYWLDRARPSQPWKPGFGNEFSWATDVVLRKLDRHVALYELGVVARLGRQEPAADERVAPVILFHSSAPNAVTGYIFAFKTNGDARVSCAIYKSETHDRPLFSEAPLRPRGGRPFAVHWDASKADPGDYRLVITGYFLDTNQPLYQTVRFVHQPKAR
jgi:hypothetical protein